MMINIMNFYFLMILSIFISLSVNSNFLMWMLLELNMMSFLPIISSKEHIEMENSMKYFLIQSWASVIFLMSFFFLNLFMNNMNYMMIFSIFLKLGVAPFHIWFISILKTSSLFILMILSTIQKIIPLVILSNISISFDLMYMIMFMNTMFLLMMLSSIMNLNKILAVSSMNNIMWMLFSIMFSLKLMFMFMMIYLFLLMGVFMLYNLYNLNMFLQMNSMNYFDKLMMTIIFMSLGGMPPLLGFLMKYIILKFIIIYEKIFFLLMIIFSSLLVLYMYLSRMYFFLTNIPSMKMNFKMAFFSFKKIIYMISLIFITFFILFQF